VTEHLSDPLVPADVDLRDFSWMPIEIHRLRRSKAWLICKRKPELAFYMLNLWTAAWHDTPAGSLEDDDDVLADLAMCPPDQWPDLREHVLRGWVKCSDGRLYHPTVASLVREAWEKKLAQRQRTEAARLARQQKQSQTRPQTTTEPVAGNVTEQPLDPPDKTGQDRDQTGHLFGGSDPAPSAAPPSPPPDFDGSNAEVLNGRAVVRLAHKFELPDQWGFDAEALGFKPREVLQEAEKFRQYWTRGQGAGKRSSVKGWRQAWSNWLGKAAERRR